MAPTRYGPQPARKIIRDRGFALARVARRIDVEYTHLGAALRGEIRPRPEVREKLPKLLGVAAEDCFTAEALAEPFGSGLDWRRGRRNRQDVAT